MASARAGRTLPFRFANGYDRVEVSPSHRLVVNDTNAYLAAGLAGLGIIQAPSYAVHAALQAGHLVAMLDEWRMGNVPVHVIYPPNRYLSAKVRVLIDWTVALFERHSARRRRWDGEVAYWVYLNGVNSNVKKRQGSPPASLDAMRSIGLSFSRAIGATHMHSSEQQTPVAEKRKQQFEIAVLDDYQGVALDLADWSSLQDHATVTVFRDHIADADPLVERLLPFDVVCVMRERTPLPGVVLERLPRLRLIASTGSRNRSIDEEAARRLGIAVAHSGYASTPTIEFTWALILGIARNIASESESVRAGGWQRSIGSDLAGKTLGVLGLGNIGSQVATIGRAFGMNVIAWSQNLTAERASAVGAEAVTKTALFERSDVLSVHLILSGRTKGLIGTSELGMMKASAYLINTSRGPIVDEQALVTALRSRRIAGAAVDVYDVEPLPPDHPFRTLPNVLATPHIGYVSRGLYETFYGDTVKNIQAWIAARPQSA